VLGYVLAPSALSAVAEQPAPVAEQIALEQAQSASVVVDGVELFRVRGVSAFPAAKRAALIASVSSRWRPILCSASTR